MSGLEGARVAASPAASDGQVLKRTARLMTWALVAVLVWLPLQTPIAIAIFQYGHSEGLSRATLLLKDVVVALLVLYALAATWRSLKLRWFDKAAIAYVVVVAIYSVVPLLGSHQSLTSVASSAREFVMPVEAYALGRLAQLAGADLRFIFKAFVAASAVIAVTAILEYFVLPITFWSSTLDLVTFERVVQVIPGADSLWRISLLGDYGAGLGVYPRAVATFTHPVGAGGYFIFPLGLTVAAWYSGEARGRRLMTVGLIGLSLLFCLATIVTLSRGSWIAAAVVVVMCGFMFRRLRVSFLCLMVVGIFLMGVRPFSDSITSALNRNDSSMLGHIEAIGQDVQVTIANIFGMGLGSADRVVGLQPDSGQTAGASAGASAGGNIGSDESTGVGENLYLSVLVSTGPAGAVTFVAWSVGVVVLLLRAVRQSAHKWLLAGVATAMVGSLISAMSSSALMRFTTAASGWLLLGLATSLVLATSPEIASFKRPHLSSPGWLSRLLGRNPEPGSDASDQE